MTYFVQSLAGPNGLILLGAIISTVGVIWASNQKSSVNDQLKQQGSTIIAQNEIIDKKSSDISDKNDKIQLTSNKLIEKSDEIAALNQEIVNHSTGGDSFPELIISSLDSETNKGQLIISNTSDKYNMFELQIRIVDIGSNKQTTVEDMLANEKLLNIGNLGAKKVSRQGIIDLGYVTEKNLNIFSSTRNGSFSQLIRLKKIDGKWLSASKVLTFEGKTLKEKVDPDFPLNSNDVVEY